VFTLRVPVALSQSKVDDEYAVLVMLLSPNEEIVWFNISVDYSFLVNLLNSLNLIKEVE
jgi:hypothetical protein